MNRSVKNLIRVGGITLGLAAAAFALRDRLLPTPQISDEPPPRFRTSGPEEGADGDDLTRLKGVGPVLDRRLNDAGISRFTDLVAADPVELAAALGVGETVVADWVVQATEIE